MDAVDSSYSSILEGLETTVEGQYRITYQNGLIDDSNATYSTTRELLVAAPWLNYVPDCYTVLYVSSPIEIPIFDAVVVSLNFTYDTQT